MVLEYKFEYTSNNNNLISIIDNILSTKNIEYKLLKDNIYTYLYISDKEENLIDISDELSQKLPMSIFLKDFTLEVVPQIPEDKSLEYSNNLNLPFCSNCIPNTINEKSENFYNPFINECHICGTTCDVKKLELIASGKTIRYLNYKTLFEFLALAILKNKKVKIKTFSGNYIFTKFNQLKPNQQLLCINKNSIEKMVVASKKEIISLFCMEKPLITFNINEVYKSKYNSNIQSVDIKYIDDLILFLLSKELKKFKIDFLEFKKGHDYDYNLTFDNKIKTMRTPKIVINDDRIFILKNDHYDKRLKKIYNTIDDKTKAQVMVLIDENNIYDKSILNIYLTTKYDDNISVYSQKIDGIVDILNFKIPKTISELFENISKDEIGKKLIYNYKKKFESLYNNTIKEDISNLNKNSIITLWKIIEKVLGFEDSIINLAMNSLLEKGPRLDYKLLKVDKIYHRQFNIIKLIQSGISFKLAGVDNKTLALGYVESFAYFLANIVDEVNDKFELDGVSLSGDFIANKLLYKLINKAITKNFKRYYNKDFPIQIN